jgi:hypothetical protein
MDNFLQNNEIIRNSRQWFSEEINMDTIIDKYGDKEQFVRRVLTWNHDNVGIQNGFVYYRTGYVVGR